MTLFWLTASALIAAVLALLLPPLLRRRSAAHAVSRKAINVAVYRDQLRELEQDYAAGAVSREGYEEARREIERRLLEDVRDEDEDARSGASGRNAAVLVGAAVPVIAFALYFAVGNFEVLLPGRAGGPEQAGHSISEEQIRELTGSLAARMEKEPDNVEGWVMLGRSYTMLGEFDNAARAYGNAVARSRPDAALLADYADALAMAQGRSLEGEPERLIHRALAIDPENVKALALAGTAAFERKEYAKATEYWERILKIAPEGSEFARSVRESIAEAQQLAGRSAAPGSAGGASGTATEAAPTSKAVSGVVEIAPSLAERVAPDDTLFIYARAAEGPRMPLAVVRAKAKDLPFAFTLDDRNAIAQGLKLSSQGRVIVGARISKSGNATPQRGDLEGASAPVEVGARNVQVVVNTETR